MMSSWMMQVLFVEYIVIAVAAIAEKNLPKFIYFSSAAGITASLLMMGKA